ncbi:MAG TPA: IS66 family transposase [Acetobacteraceae bacterium]|jgi:transposase|nr:IS66 family transposase [Acetobacteraceae bacterium]
MSSGVSSLPRDPDILIEMISGLRAENEKLRAMLETLKRTLYGARSERRAADEAQLALGLGDLSALPVEPEPEAATAAGQGQPKPLRPKAARNIGGLPNHLPREDVVIEPESDTCPCCQGKLHRIGEDVSETLDIVPAIIRVKRIRRPKYGCRACESAVVQAPAPPRPVDGGLPTAALLAHIAVSKFAWHLPLHRQTQMLAGHGIHLDRSTLVHWIERAAWWLKPLHDLLLETVMAAGKIFCDDTPLPVLDRSRKRTRIGRIWCYALDDRPWSGAAPPVLVYLYAPDRRGSHLEDHLRGFHGVLQVDGYAGYDKLARPGRAAGVIKLAYCLAHARREFFDVHKRTKDPVAEEAMRRISEVYAIEARIRGRAAGDRVAVRQAETRPLMEALWSWLMERLEEISAKSSLAGAIRYTLGHWKGLTLFLSDGRVEVDNNTVERGIRPIPLGRKNSLFAGSDSGGERWAVLASLINTAKLHGIDPQTYLADVLDRIVSGRTKVNALRELLPWEWKAAREAAVA